MKHQIFYLTVLSAAFLTATLISGVPDCIGAPPPSSGNHSRQTSAPPRQSAPHSGGQSNGNNGGRVVRRVTTDTNTGKVIKDERFGNTSPIHRTYHQGSYNIPYYDPEPVYTPPSQPGKKTTPSTPKKPRIPPRMPKSGSSFPGMPAYPPAPPGFPPPPDFWASYLYYGLPVLINVRVKVIPDYPNIQQMGVYAVYDGYGKLSGSLLVYYNRQNAKLGGYFNPVGTKYTRSIQGLVSEINGIQTANFIVNDQFKTQCTVQFSDLFGTSASGTMLIPSRFEGISPEVETFMLQRLR
ncbi:MAG: hypothetical protein IJF84_01465 [Thermoguttaceae bacterium]|nr:hypothetical protein [Thermoguttaceae bacterium]